MLDCKSKWFNLLLLKDLSMVAAILIFKLHKLHFHTLKMSSSVLRFTLRESRGGGGGGPGGARS
jgi:hypothetical protein